MYREYIVPGPEDKVQTVSNRANLGECVMDEEQVLEKMDFTYVADMLAAINYFLTEVSQLNAHSAESVRKDLAAAERALRSLAGEGL